METWLHGMVQTLGYKGIIVNAVIQSFSIFLSTYYGPHFIWGDLKKQEQK